MPESGLDRIKAINPAILVGLDYGSATHKDSLQELEQLAISAKIQVMAVVEGKRSRPDPTTYIGSGKVDEIAQLLFQNKACLINSSLFAFPQPNVFGGLLSYYPFVFADSF